MNTKQETEDAINNATTNESIHDSNSNFYSSLLQLSITPTSLMLFSSLPLIGGSYLGYKKQMRVIANETNPSNMKFAFRAFGVGSMLSVGGFGIITAGIFYATNSSSLNEFIQKCQTWAPNNTKTLQAYFGFDVSTKSYEKWKNDPDVIATQNMTEDEVLDFYKTKYVDPEGELDK